jgi:hypothetical protein
MSNLNFDMYLCCDCEIKNVIKIKHNIIFIMKLPVNNTEPFHKTVSSIYKIIYINLVAQNNCGLL